MCLPREEKKDLYLIQQFLTFQIYFFPGMSWNIELVISDLTKVAFSVYSDEKEDNDFVHFPQTINKAILHKVSLSSYRLRGVE